MTLKLERPLAVIDLETTNDDPKSARVVQIGYVIFGKEGVICREEIEINPTVPISPEATAVHGFTNDALRDKPTFEDVAGAILDDLEGCDLAGFNLEKFDIPILTREFEQCEVDFPGPDRRIVDVMTIYHRNEKRDLTAAVRFYLGCDHAGAHGALADAEATAKVLVSQVDCYSLPEDAASLEAYCHEKPDDYVDADGRLKWRGDEAVFAFGKIKGTSLREAANNSLSRDYLKWILGADFSQELKTIILNAMQGNYPVRPGKAVA